MMSNEAHRRSVRLPGKRKRIMRYVIEHSRNATPAGEDIEQIGVVEAKDAATARAHAMPAGYSDWQIESAMLASGGGDMARARPEGMKSGDYCEYFMASPEEE